MADLLSSALVESRQFIVVERPTLSDALAEQKLAGSGLVASEGAARAGQLIGASLLVKGAITEFSMTAGGGGFGVERASQVFTDPVTGRVLGQRKIRLGRVVVSAVDSDIAFGRFQALHTAAPAAAQARDEKPAPQLAPVVAVAPGSEAPATLLPQTYADPAYLFSDAAAMQLRAAEEARTARLPDWRGERDARSCPGPVRRTVRPSAAIDPGAKALAT